MPYDSRDFPRIDPQNDGGDAARAFEDGRNAEARESVLGEAPGATDGRASFVWSRMAKVFWDGWSLERMARRRANAAHRRSMA